jgi:molybdopterin-guanine dinucleotide biosynthesis protein A
MLTWSAAILAGGKARRLDGQTKPLLEVGGATILDRQRAVFAALGVEPTLIAPPTAGLAPTGLPVVADRLADGGALGALWTALDAAAADVVVVVAGDMPFVSAAFIRTLLARLDDHDAVVPRTAAGWQPLAAAYRRRVAPRLRQQLDAGERRVVVAVAALDVLVLDDAALAPLDPDGTLLCNVNTPADYARARHLGRPAAPQE